MKARCCGGEVLADGTWVVHLEVPPGTHIQIDEEWTADRGADQPAAAPSGFDVSASARFKSKSEQRRYAYQTGGCVYCLKEPCECNTDQQSGCPACGNGCYSPERGCADGKCRMYKAPSQQSSALTQGEQDTFWNALLHQGPPDKPSGA
jgi:hypothetical protein